MKRLVIALLLSVFLGGCVSSGGSRPKSGVAPENNAIQSLVLLREGSQFLQQQRFEDALKKFQESDKMAPGNATTSNMMGLCFLNLSRYDEALQAFSRSLRLIPNFTDAKNNRGLTYMAMGQYRMAELDFASVLADETYPHHWAMYYNLGLTYLRRGMKAAAEENFLKAIKAPRPIYEAYIDLARLKAEIGDTEGALDILQEARLKFSGRMEASLVLGRLLYQLGRSEEAKSYLEEVLTATPSSKLGLEAKAILEEMD